MSCLRETKTIDAHVTLPSSLRAMSPTLVSRSKPRDDKSDHVWLQPTTMTPKLNTTVDTDKLSKTSRASDYVVGKTTKGGESELIKLLNASVDVPSLSKSCDNLRHPRNEKFRGSIFEKPTNNRVFGRKFKRPNRSGHKESSHDRSKELDADCEYLSMDGCFLDGHGRDRDMHLLCRPIDLVQHHVMKLSNVNREAVCSNDTRDNLNRTHNLYPTSYDVTCNTNHDFTLTHSQLDSYLTERDCTMSPCHGFESRYVNEQILSKIDLKIEQHANDIKMKNNINWTRTENSQSLIHDFTQLQPDTEQDKAQLGIRIKYLSPQLDTKRLSPPVQTKPQRRFVDNTGRRKSEASHYDRKHRNRAKRHCQSRLRVDEDETSVVNDVIMDEIEEVQVSRPMRDYVSLQSIYRPPVRAENNIISQYFVERKKSMISNARVGPLHETSEQSCRRKQSVIEEVRKSKVNTHEHANDARCRQPTPPSQSFTTEKQITSSNSDVKITHIVSSQTGDETNTSASHRLSSAAAKAAAAASVIFNNPSRSILSIPSSSPLNRNRNIVSAPVNGGIVAQHDLLSTLSCRYKSLLNRPHRRRDVVKHTDQHPIANGAAINLEYKQPTRFLITSGWASFDRCTLTKMVDRLSVGCMTEQPSNKLPGDQSQGYCVNYQQKLQINSSQMATDCIQDERDCELTQCVPKFKCCVKEEWDCDPNETQSTDFCDYTRQKCQCSRDDSPNENEIAMLRPPQELRRLSDDSYDREYQSGKDMYRNKQSKSVAVTSSSDRLGCASIINSLNDFQWSTPNSGGAGGLRLIKIHQCPDGLRESVIASENEQVEKDVLNYSLGYWVSVDKSIVDNVVDSIVTADVINEDVGTVDLNNEDMGTVDEATTTTGQTDTTDTVPVYSRFMRDNDVNSTHCSSVQLNECSSTQTIADDCETTPEYSSCQVDQRVEHLTNKLSAVSTEYDRFPSRTMSENLGLIEALDPRCAPRNNSVPAEIPSLRPNDGGRVLHSTTSPNDRGRVLHSTSGPNDEGRVLHLTTSPNDGGFKWKKNILRRLRRDQGLGIEPWLACGRTRDMFSGREWACLRSLD